MKTPLNLFYSFILLFTSTISFGQKTLVSLGGNAVIPTASGIKRVAGTGLAVHCVWKLP